MEFWYCFGEMNRDADLLNELFKRDAIPQREVSPANHLGIVVGAWAVLFTRTGFF